MNSPYQQHYHSSPVHTGEYTSHPQLQYKMQSPYPQSDTYAPTAIPALLSPPPSARSSHIFDFSHHQHSSQSPVLLPIPSTPVQCYNKTHDVAYEHDPYATYSPVAVQQQQPGTPCTCAHHCSPIAQHTSSLGQHSQQHQMPPTPLSARFDADYTCSPHFTSPFTGGALPAQNGLFEGLGDVFVSAPPPGKYRRRSTMGPAGGPAPALLRGPSSSSIYPSSGKAMQERGRRASEQVTRYLPSETHHSQLGPGFAPGGFAYNHSEPNSPKKQSIESNQSSILPYPSPFTSTSSGSAASHALEWPFPSPRQAHQHAYATSSPLTSNAYPELARLGEQSQQRFEAQDPPMRYTDPSLCSPFAERPRAQAQPQPRMGLYPTPSPDNALQNLARQAPLSTTPLSLHSEQPSSCPPTLPSRIVDLALSNRSLVPLAPPLSSLAGKSKSTDKKKAGNNRVVSRHGKVSITVEVSCVSCGVEIGSLTVRGKSDCSTASCVASYFCRACKPLLDTPPADRRASATGVGAEDGTRSTWLVTPPPMPQSTSAEDGAPGEGEEDEPTYLDSFSCALDRLTGLSISTHFNTLPLSKSRAAILGRKSRPTAADHLTCDVCSRDVCSGSLSVSSPMGLNVRYGVEAICADCSSKYQRCSDCGGGGGPRLGIGRWRSKELFVDGHLNCSLSHVRLGSLDEMSYEVWQITDIPSSDLEALIGRMREIYCASTIANLAIPDVLEAPRAIARGFGEVQMLASDEFSVFEDWVRSAHAQPQDRPRLIGLRWSTPTPRKRQPSLTSLQAQHGQAQDSYAGAPSTTSAVFPPGKSLASYVLAEYDLGAGSVEVPLMAPRGSGEAYDQNTRLLEAVLARCYSHLDTLNSQRQPIGYPNYPDLTECWSYLQFNSSSRVLNKPETRRGFMSLREYLSERAAQGERVDEGRFPPRRDTLLPREMMRGWRVWARSVRRGEMLVEREVCAGGGEERRVASVVRRKSEADLGEESLAERRARRVRV